MTGRVLHFRPRPVSPPADAGARGEVRPFPVIVARRRYLIAQAHKVAGGVHGASLVNVARFVSANSRAAGIPADAADREAAAAVAFVAALITSWSAPSSGGPNRAA